MNTNELHGQDAHLCGLNSINIIVGRNGAGKSRFLRDLEEKNNRDGKPKNIRYISPERAGVFQRDGSVFSNMHNLPDWSRSNRATNQARDFKAESAILLQDIETIYLRRLVQTPEMRANPECNFKTDRLNKINHLFTNISLELIDNNFVFRSLVDGEIVRPNQISSGESEAVCLAAEILYFFETINVDKFNVLLIDEPDVHLHPDLQARLGKLIVSLFDEFQEQAENIAVCISTHSTSLVCSLAHSSYVSIGTKSFLNDKVEMKPATAELRKVAPFFGHPLSLSLSDDAALIIEGEDDERVWQQAARSSKGRIKVFPICADGVGRQGDLESFCIGLLNSIYDNPIAFSVRDGDGKVDEPLEHNFPLKRYRLQCYAIENLLVTDQCLAVMDTTWCDFCSLVDEWIVNNEEHRDIELIRELRNSADRLQHKKIKTIRNLICGIIGCNKPWEFVVGQAIGQLMPEDEEDTNMLLGFLGREMVQDIIFRNAESA